MQTDHVAPGVGITASLAVLLALAAPYVLISEPGTGLTLYYGAGPVGAGALAFLALVTVVVFLAGGRGRTDADTAAGIVLVLGLAMFGVAVLWATAVTAELVFSFPADWMDYHRWVVVALVGVVPLAAAAYARAVL